MGGPEKRFWSYEQIQALIRHAVVDRDVFSDFQPTLIICIAAGGFIPTRILRTCLKHKLGHNVPIQTIGLQLYDIDGVDPATSPVQRVQWLSYGTGPGQLLLQGHKILIVDEVDDSRKTLSCAVNELMADIQQEQHQHQQAHPGKPWQQPELGVFVVHNKNRPKLAQLPEDLMRSRYFSALDVEDCWCVYPWDSEDIYAHTRIAESASPLPPGALSKRQSSGYHAPAHSHKQEHANGVSNGHVANGHAQNGTAVAVSNGCAV